MRIVIVIAVLSLLSLAARTTDEGTQPLPPRPRIFANDSALVIRLNAILDHLETCAPVYGVFVRQNARNIVVSETATSAALIADHTILFSRSKYFDNPVSTNMQNFSAMVALVHEARHLNDRHATEASVISFTLPLFNLCPVDDPTFEPWHTTLLSMSQ